MDNEAKLLAQIQAFGHFKKEGIQSVKLLYPNEFHFVIEHRMKDYDQVKSELLNRLTGIVDEGRIS